MGYVMIVGTCIGCKGVFGFNPVHVPSVRIDGKREPICKACVDRVNPIRKMHGVPEIVPHPEAYKAADEGEI
jgi:hypothetical protein